MNIYRYILSFLLFTIVFVYPMDVEQLYISSNENLGDSSCSYDFGLKSEYQVDWESNEIKAFIDALKNRTLKIDLKYEQIYFTSSYTYNTYYYALQTASNKFAIIETNIKIKPTNNSFLYHLFLNIDVDCDFDMCDQRYKNLVQQWSQKIYGNTENAEIIWSLLSKQLRLNRIKLKKAFDKCIISDMQTVLQKPLCIEHVDTSYIKKIMGHKSKIL